VNQAVNPSKYDDEPVPGYPLPLRPGHSSPGRLERVLRDGHFAVVAHIVIWEAWRFVRC